MKILIAPLGRVEFYKEVTYVLNGRKKKSRTSLSLLKELKRPDRIILIVTDTLSKNGKSYEEMREEIESRILAFVKECGIPDNPEIIMAPGVGKFSEKTSNGRIFQRNFKGRMLDYYSFLLYKFSSIFCTSDSDSELSIYLDLSHGINFMPVLTYRAVRDIGRIFAINKKVTLEVYNSDPITWHPSLEDEFQINKVEESRLEFSIEKYSGDTGKFLLLKEVERNEKIDSKEKKALCKKKDYPHKKAKDLLAFLGAVTNGLILPIFIFYPDVEELKRTLNETIELWVNSISFNHNNEYFICERKVAFTEFFNAFIKVLVFAYCLNKERKSEIELREVKGLYEEIFQHMEIIKHAIEKELHKLEKIQEEIQKNKNEIDKWTLLVNVKLKDANSSGKEYQIDKRNFFAHAGFEENAVELKTKNGALLLRYHLKKIEVIKNYCLDSIKISK